MQREAEGRLAAEQAARAEEDARLRELYPLPEDDEILENDQVEENDDYLSELEEEEQAGSLKTEDKDLPANSTESGSDTEELTEENRVR